MLPLSFPPAAIATVAHFCFLLGGRSNRTLLSQPSKGPSSDPLAPLPLLPSSPPGHYRWPPLFHRSSSSPILHYPPTIATTLLQHRHLQHFTACSPSTIFLSSFVGNITIIVACRT
ncbi:hypothetical protein B296_00002507 [Ensete ventricosum]|uniref:Uncharacterized protein n=1 Tax=Ensete ventricosum TaxID=4639 RepID=A0A427AUW4_ENSVE|nr:hypothetical protein B296_00002507 [Ensete ventricosum]